MKYKDFWLKIAGSLLISQLIDTIGRENSFFQRLTTSTFYVDLVSGFVMTLLVWEVVRQVTGFLDSRYDWFEKPVPRVSLQFCLAVVLPAILSFFLTLCFMKMAYDQDIFQTSWLHNEFYSVILLLVLINLAYFTWWLFLRSRKEVRKIAPDAQLAPLVEPAGEGHSEAPDTIPPVLLVTSGGKTILLPQDSIAIAYLYEGYCYIKTRREESFVTAYTLEELERTLDPGSFFRANRQVLLSKRACRSYRSIANGKIEVEVTPSLKTPVIVSQRRASEFRKWVIAIAALEK